MPPGHGLTPAGRGLALRAVPVVYRPPDPKLRV